MTSAFRFGLYQGAVDWVGQMLDIDFKFIVKRVWRNISTPRRCRPALAALSTAGSSLDHNTFLTRATKVK